MQNWKLGDKGVCNGINYIHGHFNDWQMKERSTQFTYISEQVKFVWSNNLRNKILCCLTPKTMDNHCFTLDHQHWLKFFKCLQGKYWHYLVVNRLFFFLCKVISIGFILFDIIHVQFKDNNCRHWVIFLFLFFFSFKLVFRLKVAVLPPRTSSMKLLHYP